MILFKIGNFDFTPYILVPTYTMNEQPVYTSWNDGNGVEHWEIVRRRVEGSFTLKIYNPTHYNELVTALASAKQAGDYYSATVYINNTLTSKTINVRLNFDVTITRKRGDVKDLENIGVTVTQR